MEVPEGGSRFLRPREKAAMPLLIRAIGALAAVASFSLFLMQTGLNMGLWLREPLTSSFGIDDDTIASMPSVTVCPHPPFDVNALLDLGLNFSSDSVDELTRRLDELQGVNVSLKDLWEKAAWPLGAVVHGVKIGSEQVDYSPLQMMAPGWHRALTPLGPCLTFTPKGPVSVLEIILHRNPLKSCDSAVAVADYLESCEVIEAHCNTTCLWEQFVFKLNRRTRLMNTNVILHSQDDSPTLATPLSVILVHDYDHKDLDVWVDARRVERFVGRHSECNPQVDYSEDACRQRCAEPYHPRSLGKRPNHSTWAMKDHHTEGLGIYNELNPYPEFQNLTDSHYRCLSECKPRCSAMVFRYSIKHYEARRMSPFLQVRLRHHAHYGATVLESQAYPTSRFLADIGGSLGLFLGISLLSFWSTAGRFFQLCNGSEDKVGTRKNRLTTTTYPLQEDNNQDWKRLWYYTGLVILLIAMCTHVIIVITEYIWQPVATLLSVGTDQQPFPDVLVCPDFPFNVDVLDDFNATYPLHCTHEREELKADFLDRLPGIWSKGDVDIQRIWQNSAMDIDKYIYVVASSEPILTTNNICYKMKPLSAVDGSLDIQQPAFNSFHSICDRGSVEKILVSFPERGTEPVMVQSDKTYTHHFYDYLNYATVLTLSSLVLERVPPCQPLPYRRSNCLHHCFLETAARSVACTLPYINISGVPACTTQDQYISSTKYLVDTNSPPFTTLDTDNQCKKRCPKECQTHYYHLAGIKNVISKDEIHHLNIKLPLDRYFKIHEYISHSFFKLASQLGGIIGLYVGWSLMDAGQLLGTLLMKIPISKRLFTFSSHVNAIGKQAFRILCLTVAAVLWTDRVFEYVWQHPYYTHYALQPIHSRHFPALTVCRWPPFNLSRLADVGLTYNSDASCTYNGRFYRCLDGTSALRDLPGVWTKSIDDVWEEAAWELQDLVDAFHVNGKEFLVTDKEAALRWQPVTTEHNRCFTFTPSEEDHLISYSVTLNTNYRGERRPRVNDTVKLILNALRYENDAQTFVRLHDRRERLYKPEKDDFFETITHDRNRSKEFFLSLSRMTTLSRKGRECVSSSQYTREECVTRCKVSLAAQEAGCRLPYDTWSHLPLCNATAYSTYPRPLGTRSTFLIIINAKPNNKGKEEEACSETCLPACEQNIYTSTSVTSVTDGRKIKVTLVLEFIMYISLGFW